jgi:hypothetical protein
LIQRLGILIAALAESVSYSDASASTGDN